MHLELAGTSLHLLTEKAVWLPQTATLAIADLHLGKALHFRSEGLPLPAQAQDSDYQRLNSLLLRFLPERVLFLGDLFHSRYNSDWERFSRFIASYPQTDFVLLRGNHDILDPEMFRSSGLDVFDELAEGNLIFSHEPLQQIDTGIHNLCGHIHPGFLMTAGARQRLRLPCFFRRGPHFILPAFGSLTGLAVMDRRKGDSAFGVLTDEVRQLF